MIEMNIDAMSEICIDLRKKENKLKSLYDVLSESIRNDDLTDEEIREITMIIRRIENDCKNFKKLIDVAEKSLNLYRSYENKFLLLLSEPEGTLSEKQDVGMNDLRDINKKMEKYRFNTER